MCQENSRKMEGSGGPHPRTESSWSQTVFTLRDLASKYDDTNLPKYLFVHKDYSDESMGLHLKTGDLLEVFGFHSLPCVNGEYDAGQQGMLSVSIPLTYQGKVRKLPKCEYQFPHALDLLRHFPKFVRVTFAPRPRAGPLGLGEVLELIKADKDKEVLYAKRNGENLTIPLSCRGDFEEILFEDSKDYDLRTVVNNHLCPMWVRLTEMKRIREGFTSFKHFSGEIKLNYVVDEKLLLCRVVRDDETIEDQGAKVEVMCVPVESVCRNGTSPVFKVPTGILKDSLRMFSVVPDWDLGHMHTVVRVLNFVTNHTASIHPRKCNSNNIIEKNAGVNEMTSLSMADSPRSIPVPPPRRKKQLKAALSDGDFCPEGKDPRTPTRTSPHSMSELDRIVSGPMDNNMIAYWRNKVESASNESDAHDTSSIEDKEDEGRYGPKTLTVNAQSSIPDTPPPTPPRIDSRPQPPPPLPCRSVPKSSKMQSGPPLPPQSSKPTYLCTKPRPTLPPEPPSTPRPAKPSITDQVPPPMPEVPAGYLSMSGIAGDGEEDFSHPSYCNDSFGHGSHPRPPSPSADDSRKAFSGLRSELDRRTWERQVPLEDETEDMYTVAENDYDPVADVNQDNYLCMSFPDRISPQSHGQTYGQPHVRPPALPPRFDRYSASSTSSSTTWSSGYNSDSPEGTVNSVSDISSIPHNVSCLSVNALAESLTLLKLEKLAGACRENCIDGVMFAALTAEDLKDDPFNLSGFHLKKALMFKDEGWTPKIK